MTRQETFDLVIQKMIEQGEKCSERDQCLYRGLQGRKCAAGVLIPDCYYEQSMEGAVIEDRSRILQILDQAGHDVGLVAKLQTCHDRPNFGPTWIKEFLLLAREVAVNFELREDAIPT